MKPIQFHPDAEAEMNEAAVYYETQQHDLGKRFLASVQEAFSRIQVNPLLYRVLESDVRLCLVKTFPYGILFRIKPEQFIIIAVTHLHREPDYWKQRI